MLRLRLLSLLPLLLTGCESSQPPAPEPPPRPQQIRFDGLYRAVEDRGATEQGEKIYKLTFLRFLENGTIHLATAHGIFDLEEKTREVAGAGFLSDAQLDDAGSQGPWTLDVNKLTIQLKWESRGRWEESEGKKSFVFDKDAEPVEFTETHSGTVDGDKLRLRFESPAVDAYGEYTAEFVSASFRTEVSQ